MDEPSTLREGTLVDGRYRLDRVLGVGGVGVVYEAFDTKLRRTIALKLLKPEFAEHETMRPRFEREAATMASLVHPNLVMVLDYGLQDGTPYIVMELLSGCTLRADLDAAPISEQRARDIVMQLLQGLSYAHQRGIAHRDIKPGNIVLQEHPTLEQQVKILDFGFAKIFSESSSLPSDGAVLTRAGTAFGTPTYMAPEQVAVGDMDARTDVYAVGVMLYEMLAGVPPFQGGLSELLRKHLIAEVPSIEASCPNAQASPEFESLLKKAMAKKPEERFEDAAAFALALERLPQPWMLRERATHALDVSVSAKTMLLDSIDLQGEQEHAARGSSAGQQNQEDEAPTAMFVAKPAIQNMPIQEATQTIGGKLSWTQWVVVALSNLGKWVKIMDARYDLRPRLRAAGRATRSAMISLGHWLRRKAPVLGAAIARYSRIAFEKLAAAMGKLVVLIRKEPAYRYAAMGALMALIVAIAALVVLWPREVATKTAGTQKPKSDTREQAASTQGQATQDTPLWNEDSAPKVLLELRAQVQAGHELDNDQIKTLRQLAADDREDPRPYLLMAATYMQRGWRPDALKNYQQAYRVSHRASEDPRMLIDLMALRDHRKVGRYAQRLLSQAYGRDVTEAIDKALSADDLSDKDKKQLESLKQSLAKAG